MDIEFEWDQRKAAANFAKHGVSFEAAKDVFFDENRLYELDNESGEIRSSAAPPRKVPRRPDRRRNRTILRYPMSGDLRALANRWHSGGQDPVRGVHGER